jgi:hypothetical protein
VSPIFINERSQIGAQDSIMRADASGLRYIRGKAVTLPEAE